MALLQSARFVVCPDCGRHGTFHLSDGTVGAMVTSKDRGYFFVAQYLSDGKLVDVEASVLRKQIRSSSLFDSEEDAVLTALGQFISNAFNEERDSTDGTHTVH